jgi:hypothetical protein
MNTAWSRASASRSTSLSVLIGAEGGEAADPNSVMAGNLSRPSLPELHIIIPRIRSARLPAPSSSRASSVTGNVRVLIRGSRIGELTLRELTEVVQDAWLASSACPGRDHRPHHDDGGHGRAAPGRYRGPAGRRVPDGPVTGSWPKRPRSRGAAVVLADPGRTAETTPARPRLNFISFLPVTAVELSPS